MSLRELRVLVQALPIESAFQRAKRGHNWEDLEFIARALLDETRLHRREFIAANSEKGNSLPKFIPSPAPGYDPDKEDEEKAARLRAVHDSVIASVFRNRKVG